MQRRVFGLETEFGLTAATIDSSPVTVDSEAAAKELFLPLLNQGRSTNRFLENGGRLYLDVGAHPEYATAECDRLEDILLQDRAGASILAELTAQANSRLEKAGDLHRLYLLRNNQDSAGNSYGCHENYLLHRRRDFTQVADALVSFFISRIILVGAGAIRIGSGRATYSFAQRAEHMWDGVSSATTRSRPIINTRDEPLATSAAYRRMHVIIGDTNVSEASTLLKVGATTLLLSAIEEGLNIADLALADPMRALREINTDLDVTGKVELADGRHFTAWQIQQEIYDRTMAKTDPAAIEGLYAYVVNLWQRSISAMAHQDWDSVDTELDVAIKRKLLERYREKTGAAWDDPRTRRLELLYHQVSAPAFAESLEQSGAMKRLTQPADVGAAVHVAPQTTRARLRGMAIAAAREAHVDLSADWQHLKIDAIQTQSLTLGDPLEYEDARVDELIRAIGNAAPVLPA